jgi:hypothetical protein
MRGCSKNYLAKTAEKRQEIAKIDKSPLQMNDGECLTENRTGDSRLSKKNVLKHANSTDTASYQMPAPQPVFAQFTLPARGPLCK